MSSLAQNEIVQTLIDNNTQAAQQWLEDARLGAQAGDEDARALVALTETDEGKRALWAATCHIDLAIASCAFELPHEEDGNSNGALAELVRAHPPIRWLIEQHRVEFPLDDVNEDLHGQALADANARLVRWFAV